MEDAAAQERIGERWLSRTDDHHQGAVGRVLDEPAEAPERFRYDVVSLHEDPGQPGGLGLSEV